MASETGALKQKPPLRPTDLENGAQLKWEERRGREDWQKGAVAPLSHRPVRDSPELKSRSRGEHRPQAADELTLQGQHTDSVHRNQSLTSAKVLPHRGRPWPPLTDLVVAVTIQEVIADIGLQDCLPLLSRVGRGQALQRKTEVANSYRGQS